MTRTRPDLVSVLVPTYRNRAFVEETISSLLRQHGVDWECVVSDDASDDGTLDAVRALVAGDERFRFLSHERLGASGNWNAALGSARGEFVKLLCADDLLYDGALAHQVAQLITHPSATMVCGRRDIVDAYGRVLIRDRGLVVAHGLLTGDAAIRRFVRTGTNVFGEPSFVVFRTAALRGAGGFAPDDDYLIDVATYARVLAQGDLAVSEETIGAFRVHAQSWTAALSRGQSHQTRSCVRSVAAMLSDPPHRWEVAEGQARATANAWSRRALYGAARLRDCQLPPRPPRV